MTSSRQVRLDNDLNLLESGAMYIYCITVARTLGFVFYQWGELGQRLVPASNLMYYYYITIVTIFIVIFMTANCTFQLFNCLFGQTISAQNVLSNVCSNYVFVIAKSFRPKTSGNLGIWNYTKWWNYIINHKNIIINYYFQITRSLGPKTFGYNK